MIVRKNAIFHIVVALPLLSASILSGGCRRVGDVVWSEFAAVGRNGWDPVMSQEFMPWPFDSVTNPSDRYTLAVCVRHTSRKPLAPLHLIAIQEWSDGKSVADTLRISLTPPPNTPSGRGAYGIYETLDTLTTDLRLTPGYSVTLRSLSPAAQTRGLTNVGLVLSLSSKH